MELTWAPHVTEPKFSWRGELAAECLDSAVALCPAVQTSPALLQKLSVVAKNGFKLKKGGWEVRGVHTATSPENPAAGQTC